MTLKRSNDRKVAADVTKSGGIKIANAFGLPSGKSFSCPGQTSVCEKVCYAGKLEKIYKGVRENLTFNWNQLKDADLPTMVTLLDEMITDFEAECDKKNGTKKFRIHWDGDFFSDDYAVAWATVIIRHPNVKFWAYTRTFGVVEHLTDISNLSLYLSVDRDNLNEAKKIRREFPNVRWAFLGQTNESTKEEMKEISGKPGAICPENVKRIPLITENGGACITCDLCVSGKADVRFAIGKK